MIRKKKKKRKTFVRHWITDTKVNSHTLLIF